MQESPIKREAAWVPPVPIDRQTLNAIERVEKLLQIIADNTRPAGTPAQHAPTKQGNKRR